MPQEIITAAKAIETLVADGLLATLGIVVGLWFLVVVCHVGGNR